MCARACVRTLHSLFAYFFFRQLNSHEDDINTGIGSTRAKERKLTWTASAKEHSVDVKEEVVELTKGVIVVESRHTRTQTTYGKKEGRRGVSWARELGVRVGC